MQHLKTANKVHIELEANLTYRIMDELKRPTKNES